MLSNCNLLLSFALLLAACSGNTDIDPAVRKQFTVLDDDLNRMAGAPEADWIEHLERIKAAPVTDPSVARLRDLCTSAYEAFADATVRLHEARGKVALAEQNARAPEGMTGDRIRDAHADAMRSTESVSAALDKAEGLVRSCMKERQLLRDRLAGHTTPH